MKIFVLISTNNLSGGTELLYQLFNSLHKLHQDTFISFFPEDTSSASLKRFAEYNPLVSSVEDKEENVIIIPESATFLVRQFKHAKIFVFWMSIDNYLRRKSKNFFSDFLAYYGSLLTSRVPLSSLKNVHHLFQSYYAQSYLENLGFHGLFLGDYLGDSFFDTSHPTSSHKENIVCYNPKKGYRYVKKLIKLMPSVEFVPIINMSPNQVKDTLLSSKVYLDFGHHPGKDRIPREAALSDCIVITSTFGSASNNIDINIPQIYKFNPKHDLSKCSHMINFCFEHYLCALNSQLKYKESIFREKDEFQENVNKLFALIR